MQPSKATSVGNVFPGHFGSSRINLFYQILTRGNFVIRAFMPLMQQETVTYSCFSKLILGVISITLNVYCVLSTRVNKKKKVKENWTEHVTLWNAMTDFTRCRGLRYVWMYECSSVFNVAFYSFSQKIDRVFGEKARKVSEMCCSPCVFTLSRPSCCISAFTFLHDHDRDKTAAFTGDWAF